MTPDAASLRSVISTVFMHVQKPMVAYACATPPVTPPAMPPPTDAPRLRAKYSASEATKRSTAPLVDASIQAHGMRPW